MSNEVANRASGAVAALTSLKSGLQNVSSTIVAAGGDPFLRLLQDGTWVYGAENIEVEEGSSWAVNPLSLKHGWVSWTDHPGKQANEIVGEVMVPMTSPLPLQTEMRDTGWPWVQQLSFDIKCLDGEDKGVQVLYKTTSVGGMAAIKTLIGKIMAQLDVAPGKPVPVIHLGSDHYSHKKYGKTFTPVLEIVDWIDMEGAGAEGEAEDVKDTAVETAPAEEPKQTRSRTSRGGTRAATPAEKAEPEQEPAAQSDDAGSGTQTIRRRRRNA